MHRACRRSHISRAPFAPLRSGAHSAPAWVGWLLANAMRVRLCYGLRLGGGSRKPQRPNQLVYKNGWPLLPLQQSKNYADAATQSLSRTMLEKRGQKGKFFRRQKFVFYTRKPLKFTGYEWWKNIIKKLIWILSLF